MLKYRYQILTFVLAMFGISLNAYAQVGQPPTDKELQANYCLAIKKAQFAWWRSTLTPIPNNLQNADQVHKMQENQSAKMQGDINRLETYLAKSNSRLDTFQMQAAYDQGDSDFKYLMDNEDSIMKSIDECVSNKCKGVPQSQLPTCRIRNNKGCTDELNFEQRKRIRKCDDLSFIPL